MIWTAIVVVFALIAPILSAYWVKRQWEASDQCLQVTFEAYQSDQKKLMEKQLQRIAELEGTAETYAEVVMEAAVACKTYVEALDKLGYSVEVVQNKPILIKRGGADDPTQAN
jgi:uncharacterized protein Yka (UPF0111/DUF47 family)